MVQNVTILVAPALFGATIYMDLGRIIAMLREDAQLIVRRTWLTKIFVADDVVSFMAQAAGAGLMANEGKHSSTGGWPALLLACSSKSHSLDSFSWLLESSNGDTIDHLPQ